MEVGQELEGKHGMVGQWTHLFLRMKAYQARAKIFLGDGGNGFDGIGGGHTGVGGGGWKGLLIGRREEGVLG